MIRVFFRIDPETDKWWHRDFQDGHWLFEKELSKDFLDALMPFIVRYAVQKEGPFDSLSWLPSPPEGVKEIQVEPVQWDWKAIEARWNESVY